MTTFRDLGLSQPILDVLERLEFEQPTAIQEEVIPILLDEPTDLVGLAQTGTGKTAAFALPLLERLDESLSAIQGLILSPTRELGQQIARQLEIFAEGMPELRTLAVYGGAPITGQLKSLRRATPHIVIATPGRLIDLLKRKAVDLSALQYVVFDEADEMLNMGFKDELDTILAYTPDHRKTWLFSATMPPEIQRIADTYMADPVVVKTNRESQVNTDIEHRYVVLRQRDKAEALLRLLDAMPGMRGVVFCRTRKDTQELAEHLLQRNYRADALHGDLSQPQRDRVMRRFRSQELQVLIATDVAARGIDVDDLTHVFHYTLPDDAEYYTHRAGRTGRAGKQGVSIAFVSPSGERSIRQLRQKLEIDIEPLHVPSQADITEDRIGSYLTKVLAASAKKADPELLQNAEMIFGSMTKSEVLAKLIAHQMTLTPAGSERDLNADFLPFEKSNKRKYRDRDRRRKRGAGRHQDAAKAQRNSKKKWRGKPKKKRR